MITNVSLNHQVLSQYEEPMEVLGFPPHWALNQEFFHMPLKEALETQYGFGRLIEIEGGSVDLVNGHYLYPGDDRLKPLIKIERGDETYYQYDYAIIAIVQKSGETFVTRMD